MHAELMQGLARCSGPANSAPPATSLFAFYSYTIGFQWTHLILLITSAKGAIVITRLSWLVGWFVFSSCSIVCAIPIFMKIGRDIRNYKSKKLSTFEKLRSTFKVNTAIFKIFRS